MIVPCLLCREPLPSVPLEHEKHLQSEHKVNFHKSLIIRKTLKERRRPTMYEKEAINDESDVINVTCLLCRESLPSLLPENEKHFQSVHKINFHLSWIIGKNLKEGRKSVSIMNENLKKQKNTILCDDYVQIGEISKCLTENQNRKMEKFVPDDFIENERKQFSCDICGKLFETERSVKTHKRNRITNVSKEVKTKKEINWDISKKGDIKNEELKEYSIKVSGGTRYVGPYGEVFIPVDCEEDSGNEENNNSEEKENYNIKAGMNVEEDERESLWKGFMSDLADEDDNTEENVSENDEPEERNSQERHRKENKKNQIYENMNVEEDENRVNIQTEKTDCSAKSSTGRETKKYLSKMPSENIQCIPCQKTFPKTWNLKLHMTTKMHFKKLNTVSKKTSSSLVILLLPGTIFSCDVCQKNFQTYVQLDVHLQRKAHLRIMRGGKIYTCDVCNKGMSSKTNLKIHLKIHTGEKSYKCDACPKAFGQGIGLERHKKRHIGKKDFPCTECTKAFYENQSLRNHMVIHTGEKPFACEQCGKCFAHVKSLKIHTLNHAGI